MLITSSILTGLWLRQILPLPKISAEFAAKLVELYGAENAEQIADLELILGFLIFLPGVALATLAFIYLRQVWSRK
ncbi:hypothetical protein [Agrobacterium larrymoorei]|uniref:Uncharacterized protein n=1 Tax=Agrobacterium larrymoorei TaxID=160699 RepID=A0AAF0HA54_9HYPH|nr:hypothetical protein [Agrobacterium larrymoorei]WHA40640.1 hypothetical protein CFBP5477_012550 [Agrobacterium larrymoorei]